MSYVKAAFLCRIFIAQYAAILISLVGEVVTTTTYPLGDVPVPKRSLLEVYA